MEFVSKGAATLQNGNYLYSTTPITNSEFVEAQTLAHKLVTLSNLTKGKTFKVNEVYTKAQLQSDLIAALSTKDYTYVEAPKAPERPINDAQAKEALDWMKFGKESDKANRVNSYMQRFNVLRDYEEVGLFFEGGLVKLAKIYTVNEIQEAVTTVIDLPGVIDLV
jgi:hypothetical protein